MNSFDIRVSARGIKMKNNLKYIQKLILLFASISFTVSIMYLHYIPPAEHFETSIYSAYPAIFWILFSGAILSSMSYIILHFYNPLSKKYLLYSIFLIFFAYCIFFFLPIIRGYANYGRGRTDILAHIGYTKDILLTNYIGEDNYYPILHLILLELNFIGLSMNVARTFISAFFTIIYITFIYLYSKELLGDHRKSLIILFCSLPLLYSFFHLTLHPNILSFMMIPLFLFIFEKLRSRKSHLKMVLLITLFSFFIVFFHPVTTLILMIIIITSFSVGKIYNNHTKQVIPQYSFNIFLILTVSLFTWYLNFSKTLKSFSKIIMIFFSDIEHETLTEFQIGTTVSSGLNLSQIIIRFIELYGQIIIYMVLAIILFISIFKKLLKRNVSFPEFYFMIQFGVGFIIAITFLFIYLIEFNPIRVSRSMILFATMLIGLSLSNIISNSKIKYSKKDLKKLKSVNFKVLIIVILILISTVLSINNVYRPNNHLTYSEKDGVEWFLDNGNISIDCITHKMSIKIVYYLKGVEQSKYLWKVFQLENEKLQIPKHIGYDENKTVGQTFNNRSVYIIIKAYDINYYKMYYPNQWKYLDYYTPEDVEKLEQDISTDNIYDNGECKVWTVNF